jgi:hypothetical protein
MWPPVGARQPVGGIDLEFGEHVENDKDTKKDFECLSSSAPCMGGGSDAN